jgi:hypothetical protein
LKVCKMAIAAAKSKKPGKINRELLNAVAK